MGDRKNGQSRVSLFRDHAGTLMAEAAIVLPVFIIGVLTLGYLIKGLYIQETIHAEAVDLAFQLSIEAGVTDNRISVLFPLRLSQRLEELEPMTKAAVKSSIKSEGSLFLIDVHYRVPVRLPFLPAGSLSVSETVLCRAWQGKEEETAPLSFLEMEKESESDPVWVFPRAGEKHHKESCRYIQVFPTEKILTREVTGRYDPCRLCNAKELEYGSVVYCFTSSGSVYHRYDCKSVDRYVMKLPRQEAERAGYGSCQVCGG